MNANSTKKIDTDAMLAGLDDDLNLNIPQSTPVDMGGSQRKLPAQSALSRRSERSNNKRTTIHELDPLKGRVWSYYDRFSEEWFSYEECQTLIDSIRQHGQKVNGVVRFLQNDPEGIEYEVIFGGRRHFAASYLTQHEGDLYTFKATAIDANDHEASVLMDLENRVREDISGFERCVSYRRLLGKTPGSTPIFSSINHLIASISAEDSNPSDQKPLSKSAVSQMVSAAELNEMSGIISLFKGRRRDIPWSFAYKLMQLWKKDEGSYQLEISQIANDLKHSADQMSPEEILKILLKAGSTQQSSTQTAPEAYKEQFFIKDKVALKAAATEKELSLKIPMDMLENCSQASLIRLVKEAMNEVKG